MRPIVRLIIREMTAADLPTAQRLLKQLGTDLDLSEITRRFASVAEAAGHQILAADINGSIAGFLHVYARPALEKSPEAVVQALVVDADYRESGIGRILMEAAEHWARQKDFNSVALSSHISRETAHAFYEALGYQVVAISNLLRKEFTREK